MVVLLMYSTHRPSTGHLARLAALAPGLRVVDAGLGPGGEAAALAAAPEAEVILGHRYLAQVLPATRRLRWVQSTAGGVDRLPLPELAARGVRLTRSPGASGTIARHAHTLAWTMQRGIPAFHARQQTGVWEPAHAWLPAPRRALVLGTGPIGVALALLLAADGLDVTGVRRRPEAGTPPGFARVDGPGAWAARLPETDWLFGALPHGPETCGVMGAAVFAALPPHALVVNVGRGETLDTDALAAALRRGHLGGAALDVLAPKPAAPSDPLWHTPRLLITPYVAAHARERTAEVEAFAEAQLARYVAGAPLEALVPADTSPVAPAP